MKATDLERVTELFKLIRTLNDYRHGIMHSSAREDAIRISAAPKHNNTFGHYEEINYLLGWEFKEMLRNNIVSYLDDMINDCVERLTEAGVDMTDFDPRPSDSSD